MIKILIAWCVICQVCLCIVSAQAQSQFAQAQPAQTSKSKIRVGLGLAGNDGFSSGWLLSASYVRPIDNLLELEAGFSMTHAVDAPFISPAFPQSIMLSGSAANQILVEVAMNIHPLSKILPGFHITGGFAYREMQILRSFDTSIIPVQSQNLYQNIGELVAVFKIGVDIPITERLGLTMRVGAYGRSVPVDYSRSLLFGNTNITVGL